MNRLIRSIFLAVSLVLVGCSYHKSTISDHPKKSDIGPGLLIGQDRLTILPHPRPPFPTDDRLCSGVNLMLGGSRRLWVLTANHCLDEAGYTNPKKPHVSLRTLNREPVDLALIPNCGDAVAPVFSTKDFLVVDDIQELEGREAFCYARLPDGEFYYVEGKIDLIHAGPYLKGHFAKIDFLDALAARKRITLSLPEGLSNKDIIGGSSGGMLIDKETGKIMGIVVFVGQSPGHEYIGFEELSSVFLLFKESGAFWDDYWKMFCSPQ